MDRISNIPSRRFFLFIGYGVVNTGITYLIYLLLTFFTHYQIAYLISYILGIVLAYLLNQFLVFRGKSTFKKFFQYPFIYIAQYTIGSFLLYIFVKLFFFPEKIAPLTVSIILIPITYTMNKIVLLKR
jgi:putative flippase GtrA